MNVVIAEELITLLAEKAAWHPTSRTLLVTDLHLGKDAAFRARGMAVPAGSDAATLAALGALVSRLQPKRLEILGDLFHGPESRSPQIQMEFWNLIRDFSATQTRWVTGNHDRHVRGATTRDAASAAGMEIVEEAWLGQVRLCHEPPEDGAFLCGHLHPGFSLTGKGRQRVKLPCFWKTGAGLILPAFGAFTGLSTIAPAKGDQVFVATGTAVFEVPLG